MSGFLKGFKSFHAMFIVCAAQICAWMWMQIWEKHSKLFKCKWFQVDSPRLLLAREHCLDCAPPCPRRPWVRGPGHLLDQGQVPGSPPPSADSFCWAQNRFCALYTVHCTVHLYTGFTSPHRHHLSTTEIAPRMPSCGRLKHYFWA